MDEKNEPLIFCRLCGKYKPINQIEKIELATLAGITINYDGCKDCSVIIHNARVIVKETATKFIKERSKIVMPQ